MDRLSALDAEFLHLEDGVAHMHVFGVSVFEGPAPPLDDQVRLLTAKLHLIPRYRQRVRLAPLGLGRPVSQDDPHFNLTYHLRHTALPAPGDDADLCRLMARLMSQPLDRNRPLWEASMVEGLPAGRWAVISKVHHCMVDGISGVELLTVLLSAERDGPLPEPQPWEPALEPAGLAVVLDAWRGLAGDLAAGARRVPAMLRDPVGAARSASRTRAGMWRFARRRSRSRARSGRTGSGRIPRRASRTSAPSGVPAGAR
jgi:diacylglycerol O-acyltransferase / wax synthase